MSEPIDTDIVRLTKFSHGAGCGCKLSPQILDGILSKVTGHSFDFPSLLVGNKDRDDAAVMDMDDGTAIISTTDFFMPIVDDPEDFGRIAAANAISDIYAMGGSPMMAIAILGWPVEKLSASIAGKVISGAQEKCLEAGIPLAGGHSIDSPEPIFGLAVTGRVDINCIKKNGGAKPGDVLYLTKPLGTGILSTAQKKDMLQPAHERLATEVMIKLNSVGETFSKIDGVHAMTDVTGFGLGGHLLEMCRASQASAEVTFKNLPVIHPVVFEYIDKGAIPGGTHRNLNSYGRFISFASPDLQFLVCDPQTSGGLLIAVDPEYITEVEAILHSFDLPVSSIGRMISGPNSIIDIS